MTECGADWIHCGCGEARNHEDAEAEVERILGPYSSVLTPSIVAERIVAVVLDAVRCAQGCDTDAALAQVQSAQARAARSPQGDPTVSWEQWNDEVNTRISVQIELADARAEIKRLGELLDGETNA